jgi:Fic family protein
MSRHRMAGVFLERTEVTARAATEAAKQILTLSLTTETESRQSRAASSALRVHEYMEKKPPGGIGALATALKLSIPTVAVALNHLVRLGIAKEMTGKRRARLTRLIGYSRYRE